MKTLITLFCLMAGFYGTVAAQDTFRLDKDYKINPGGVLNMKISDAKVHITGSARTTAHVKIEREIISMGLTLGHEEFRVDVMEEGGDLTIKEVSNSVSVGTLGYRTEHYSINVEVPEGVSLRIRGDDGDFWITNVDGSISMDLDDADVELKGCSGTSFSFKMDDGRIKMDEAKGTLELEADDTDVEIKNAAFTSIDVRMDDGDLILETSLSDNGDYKIDAQDGMISMTILKGGGYFDIRHDDGRVTSTGGFSMQEDSENHARMTLANGSAKVSIRADDARVKLASR